MSDLDRNFEDLFSHDVAQMSLEEEIRTSKIDSEKKYIETCPINHQDDFFKQCMNEKDAGLS